MTTADVGIAHLPTFAVSSWYHVEEAGEVTALDDFRPVAEVAADERARIALGKAGAHKGDRYTASVNADGAILLTPLASIPKRELMVWENAELRASLFRGLADAAEGNARPLDWVTANDEDDGDA